MTWAEYCESGYNNDKALENGDTVSAFWIDGTYVKLSCNTTLYYIADATANSTIVQNCSYQIVEIGETVTFALEYTKNSSILYKEYTALSGMTWQEFVNSNYNDGTFYISGETVCYTIDGDTGTLYGVAPTSPLVDGCIYSDSSISSGENGDIIEW